MPYLSTRGGMPPQRFTDILLGGLAPDGGLVVPDHYPAIDVLHSASRLMTQITASPHRAAAGQLREMLAVYENAKDLINIGAYAAGSNPRIDRSLRILDDTRRFLRQDANTFTPYEETIARLQEITAEDG